VYSSRSVERRTREIPSVSDSYLILFRHAIAVSIGSFSGICDLSLVPLLVRDGSEVLYRTPLSYGYLRVLQFM
jgi:hypothetical protein